MGVQHRGSVRNDLDLVEACQHRRDLQHHEVVHHRPDPLFDGKPSQGGDLRLCADGLAGAGQLCHRLIPDLLVLR